MLQKLDPGSYFGSSTDLYASNGLSVAETVFPSAIDIPAHEHTNAFFCFVLEGRATRSWHGRSGAERPMSLTIFPSDLPHANRWHVEGGRVLHVEFGNLWLERLREFTTVLNRPADFSKGPPVWLAQRMIAECRSQDDVSPLVIEGLVLELLAECSRAYSGSLRSSPPPWVHRARQLLQDRFTEKLSLTEIATVCGVSADYLARAFRQHCDCTVGEYIRKLRIDHACHRLAKSDASIADIAFAAGFTDQSHFTKVFQRHMRVSPKQFRILHRGGRLLTKS